MKFEKYFYGHNEIVAFIDESGDTSLRDPGNPVFVFGACVAMGRDFPTTVRAPWLDLREKIMGDKKRPLHMREISHRLSPEKLQALNTFFLSAKFKRVSIAITDRTSFENTAHVKKPVMEIGLSLLLNYIAEVMAGDSIVEGVSLVFENGPMIDKLRPHWARRELTRSDGVKLPVNWGVLDKGADEPALEAADFIAHTTAGFMRDKRDPKSRFAPRYAAVFPIDQPNICRGIELNNVKLEEPRKTKLPDKSETPHPKPFPKPDTKA